MVALFLCARCTVWNVAGNFRNSNKAPAQTTSTMGNVNGCGTHVKTIMLDRIFWGGFEPFRPVTQFQFECTASVASLCTLFGVSTSHIRTFRSKDFLWADVLIRNLSLFCSMQSLGCTCLIPLENKNHLNMMQFDR